LKGLVFARYSTTVIGLKKINANQNMAFANDNRVMTAAAVAA